MNDLNERSAMEYADAAGYPDGLGFLDEGTARLVDEVTTGGARDLDLPSTDADEEVAVLHRVDEQRFVAVLGDREIATIAYHDEGGRYVIYHTYVEPAFRGRGVAADFIADVLDDIREIGRPITPVCPVVAAFIASDPRYADLVR
ncbi:GNAT family N-acetyltransferase [Leifsonia sp. NPDC080035]|uniref:GNAT family N-acetyltransferase n=1 Tax=Leifsonia sp. NPDC080035 TaxID=3143936 RepID=A0AAU7GGG5_9MICO